MLLFSILTTILPPRHIKFEYRWTETAQAQRDQGRVNDTDERDHQNGQKVLADRQREKERESNRDSSSGMNLTSSICSKSRSLFIFSFFFLLIFDLSVYFFITCIIISFLKFKFYKICDSFTLPLHLTYHNLIHKNNIHFKYRDEIVII